MKRRAFTLVELLVVIGIIALLISILLPSLAKARESANRIKCAANLRTFGQVAHLFANDHKGYFPAAWAFGQDGNGSNAVCLPVLLNYNPDTETAASSDAWRRFGTPYQVLLRYSQGSGDQQMVNLNGSAQTLAKWLICPSTASDAYQVWSNVGGGWGWGIETSYVYVGGLTARTIGSFPQFGAINNISGFNFGTRIPAMRNNNPASYVLAADTVSWGGGGAWGNTYVINHRQGGDYSRAEFQNVLFADGHVEGQRPDYFDSVNNNHSNQLNVNNWSLQFQVGGPDSGRYYYWGQ